MPGLTSPLLCVVALSILSVPGLMLPVLLMVIVAWSDSAAVPGLNGKHSLFSEAILALAALADNTDGSRRRRHNYRLQQHVATKAASPNESTSVSLTMQNDAFAEANTGELSGASTTIQNFVNASLIRKPPKFAAVTPAGAYTEEIPQRPVRIGRGGKYYELMYVDGVAREIPVQQRKQQDQPFPSRFQEPRAEADGLSTALVGQVLEIQDLHNSELQPQPSARRRRSRQGPLAAQPTPPIRRHRPGSLRSKESTPSRESPDVSISEDSTKETPKAQPPLGIVLEYDSQDTEALYHSVPPPVPVQEANLTRSIAAPKVPFYNLTCRAQPPENVKEFKNAVPSAEFLLAKTVTDEKRSKSPSPHRVPLPEDTLSQAVSAVQNTASPMSDRITSTELPSSAVEQVVPNSQLEDMSRPTQEINPSLTMQKRSPHLPMRTPPQCKPEPRFFVKNACLSVTEPVHSVQCEEAAQTHQEAFTAVTLTPAATTAFQLELQQSSSRQPSPQVLHGRMPHLDRQPSPRLNTVESCTHEQHRQPPSTSTSNSGTNDTSRDSLRTASLAAPIVHREVLDEPSLGTTSPESLKDWYDEEENPYDEDNEDEPIKRKPSKIIRRLQGLFERKRPDDPSANVTGERKRLDQLDAPPPSPREPTTPTKKSKLGQFFSFSKKDNKGKHSPPPELFCPAVQGPEIPDGMLAKVFMSRLTEEKQAERTRTQSCAPPVINFRDWSPSSEDLTVFDRQKPAKPKSPPKSSRFYVPEIPPFQSKPASAKSKVPSGKHSSDSTGDMLSPPDCTGEAQNSPYSGCRDRANANILGPRRTSLASDDVAALYDEFYDREKRSVLCEEATKS
ncbi:hypothetical protein BIW11_06591, partial [Tropilaelaps mercedesae]